jgi:hypothetical protein
MSDLTIRSISMRLLPTALFLCFAGSCVAEERGDKASQELSSRIDQLCQWTGMTRHGPITSIEQWHTKNPGYNVSVDLGVGRTIYHYLVRFDGERKLISFIPGAFQFGNASLGADTLRDPKARALSIAAVNKLNQQLHWKRYGPETIQKIHGAFCVTYQTVSKEKQAKSEARGKYFLDPYVSFLVTRGGIVFGAFWGA